MSFYFITTVYSRHRREEHKGTEQHTQGTEPVWRVFADNTRGGAARNFAEWPKGPKEARRVIARVKTISFITTMHGGGESM